MMLYQSKADTILLSRLVQTYFPSILGVTCSSEMDKLSETMCYTNWWEYFFVKDYCYGTDLSKVYCLAVARQNSAAPRAPQAMPYRALFRQLKGPWSIRKHHLELTP